MPAVYPGTIRAFSTKIDLTDTVFALHMNDVQDEITSIQTVLGTNPQGGVATVKARIEALETGKSASTHDHTNRLDIAAHDVEARHTFGAAYGTPATPTAITAGAVSSAGTGDNPAREDHAHAFDSAAIGNALLPAGTIVAYGGTTAPAGWALCNGAAVARGSSAADTYYRLFQAIGTAYGAGNGTTTFNLPNLQDRFPLGRATPTTAIASGGSKNATLVSHNHSGSSVSGGNADHTHWMSHSHSTDWQGSHEHSMYSGWAANADIALISIGGPNNYRIGDADDPVQGPFAWFGHPLPAGSHEHGTDWESRTSTDGASGAANHGHGLTIATQGSSATDANMPPYQTVNYIVKL